MKPGTVRSLCAPLALVHDRHSHAVSCRPGWYEAAVQNLGLNFSVVYTSYQGLIDAIKEMHEQSAAGIFYW